MEKINVPCPYCKKKSIVIDGNSIYCENQKCDFTVNFLCPICDCELNDLKSDKIGEYFLCSACKNKIHLKRIKYLIENYLHIDKTLRCPFCNGPTIDRKQVNLAHRCLFFPGCSGQGSLFSEGKKESLTFFDLETTGLEIGKDSIIEIGAVKIDEEGFEHTFQTFVKPREQILNEKISRFTGITNEMLNDAPDLKSCLQKFSEFAHDSTLVAHNADFDLLWMLTSANRHKIELKNKNIICTLKWAEKLNESHKSLSFLSKKYNISHINAHRALADAASTKELFFIFENLKKEPRPLLLIESFIERAKKIVRRFEGFIQE